MPDLAVIGAGIMGANHVRTARALREWDHVMVVDPDLQRATAVARGNGFQASAELSPAIAASDAVIVAVPSHLHEEVAQEVLQAGKHVLIEKPVTDSVASARRLAELARRSAGRVLVGHVERFNSAVVEIIDWSSQAIHLEFRRVGPKGGRVLGDVVSDLMVHDLEIFLAIARERSGTGHADVEEVTALWSDGGEDLCSALVRTADGLTASFTSSRLGQVKSRTVTMTGRDVQVVGDLVRQSVSIYRMAHTEFVDAGGARYRQTGTTEIPFLDSGEPLMREQRHFLEVVNAEAAPLISVDDALAAMELVDRVKGARR